MWSEMRSSIVNGTSGLITRASPIDPAVDKQGVHTVKTKTNRLGRDHSLQGFESKYGYGNQNKMFRTKIHLQLKKADS